MSSVSQIEGFLRHILQEQADQFAINTGFIQRVREFRGSTFAQLMILGQMQTQPASLSDLAHFARHLKVTVSKQGIEKRFTATTAAFFHELLNVALTQVVTADPVAIPLLQRFSEVIVEDSSTIELPDELLSVWKGCGGKYQGTFAAVKVHTRLDLLNGSLSNVQLGHGRHPDLKSPFKANRRQRRSLRMADLGYFDTAVFEEESTSGVYWLTRVKVGNLVIFDEQGNRLDLVAFLQEHARDGNYECWVQVSATRRVKARLLAYPVPEEVAVKRQQVNARKAQRHSRPVNLTIQDLTHWTLLITNVPPDLLSAHEALILLRARWQIELLYKLWKQDGHLDSSCSENPWRIISDLYAKLIGTLLTHWLMIVGCWKIPNRSMVNAAKAVRKQANLIARALNGRGDLGLILQEIIENLDGCRQDTRLKHPSTSQLLLACSSSDGESPQEGGILT